jgi:hypothetical protein
MLTGKVGEGKGEARESMQIRPKSESFADERLCYVRDSPCGGLAEGMQRKPRKPMLGRPDDGGQ